MTTSFKARFDLLTKLRWLARIASLLCMLILLMFFIGEGFRFETVGANELVGLAFFPAGLVLGFIVGWKKEILGGTISILSVLCFYGVYGILVRGSLPKGYAFAVFASPAILFLIAGFYAEAAIGKGSEEVPVDG